MALPVGHYIRDVNVQDSAQAHFGDQYFTGGLTISELFSRQASTNADISDAKSAPLGDYNGLYAYNALSPVSTYVDRPDLRCQLETQLHHRLEHTLSSAQVVVVQGIGGVGKTQLVLDYIRRYRQDYSGVFWIEASRPEAIERDYIQIYTLLYNVRQEVGEARIELQHAVTAVKKWFYERGKKALFVFDNADSIRDPSDPSYIDLRRFLPDDPNSHVILTTRDRLALELSRLPAVEVDEMRSEEAAQLFQRQAKLGNTTPEQQKQIHEIAQTLGYLALAITLAASYVAVTPRLQRDLASYLIEYDERRKELLAQRPTWLVHQYGQSVLTTWETTFAAMEIQHPEACQFLELLSCFSQDDIPATIPIDSPRGGLPAWESVLFSGRRISGYDIEAFFRTLTSFSFVKYRVDQHSYTMHSLVQAWAHDRLSLDQQQHYCYAGALMLVNMTYHAENVTPRMRERLVPHVVSSCHRISTLFESEPVEHRSLLTALGSMSLFLYDCGRDEEDMVVRRIELLKCQSWYGEHDSDTLSRMYGLGVVLRDLRRPQEALSILQVALEKQQEILRADDPAIQRTRHGIALSLWGLGQRQEALSMQREVLKTQQQILDDNDLDRLESGQHLSTMLADMGRLQEALSMQRALLEKYRQSLGPHHSGTLDMACDLAFSLIKIGDVQGAFTLVHDVVERSRLTEGENHPHTLACMTCLAWVRCNLRDFDEALSMQQDAVKRAEKHLRPSHPVRLRAVEVLDLIERRFAEADEAQEQEGCREREVEEAELGEAREQRRSGGRWTRGKEKRDSRGSARLSLSSLIDRLILR